MNKEQFYKAVRSLQISHSKPVLDEILELVNQIDNRFVSGFFMARFAGIDKLMGNFSMLALNRFVVKFVLQSDVWDIWKHDKIQKPRKLKSDHLHDLAIACFNLQERVDMMDENTKDLTMLAKLAREGKKDTEEYRLLERKVEIQDMHANDIGDQVRDIIKITKRLREYKFKKTNETN